MKKIPELLAPAGGKAAIEAAIEAGADAVYFGLPRHNARALAENVKEDELYDVLALCRAHGVRSYVTLNTLARDGETNEILRMAERLYVSGADALIVADLGVAFLIKKYLPGFPLHASTQASGHNVDAARFLAERGFSRMVLAREMSFRDIKYFCGNSPIESEVFVHGALCVSASGQCLFSSMVGGRSGNLGECAQPCRLPYSTGKNKKEGSPLSLKDLSLASHIPELIDAGVDSLKIEGRMKSPEYVRDVTRIYRRLLDGRRAANADEISELERIFSRSGSTDGYFTGKVGRGMLGVRTELDKQKSRDLAPFEKLTKKVPVKISARITAGEPASLCVSDGAKSVTVYAEPPERAKSAPTDKESIKKQLSKLGGTPYIIEKIELSCGDDVFLPLSKINELRRRAIAALLAPGENRSGFALPALQREEPLPSLGKGTRTARFLLAKNMPGKSVLDGFFDIVYLPLSEFGISKTGAANGVILPPVIFDHEREEVEKMLGAAQGAGAVHALVSNVGHIGLAKKYGFTLHGDLRLNVANRESARALLSAGLCDLILSPELSLAAVRDIGGPAALVVYGRLPLMTLERCVVEDCSECGKNRFALTDRRGVDFPVFREYPHRNVLYNSVPVYMADRADTIKRSGVASTHFIFTDESAKKAANIIKAYKNGDPPISNVRRIK